MTVYSPCINSFNSLQGLLVQVYADIKFKASTIYRWPTCFNVPSQYITFITYALGLLKNWDCSFATGPCTRLWALWGLDYVSALSPSSGPRKGCTCSKHPMNTWFIEWNWNGFLWQNSHTALKSCLWRAGCRFESLFGNIQWHIYAWLLSISLT